MKWITVICLIVILSSCGSDKLYSQQSRTFKKHFKTNLDVERLLSIQGGGSFNLPNYPATDNGYMITPKVFDGGEEYALNNEVVKFDPNIGDHYLDSNQSSPFGRNNSFTQNDITADSFYVPRKLKVNAPSDFEISADDIFTWQPDPKNKCLTFSIIDHDTIGNTLAKQYLIKDDGQFVMPASIVNQLNAEYVNVSFSRYVDKTIKCSDGKLIKVITYSGSSGLFKTKKAAQ